MPRDYDRLDIQKVKEIIFHDFEDLMEILLEIDPAIEHYNARNETQLLHEVSIDRNHFLLVTYVGTPKTT